MQRYEIPFSDLSFIFCGFFGDFLSFFIGTRAVRAAERKFFAVYGFAVGTFVDFAAAARAYVLE
jgi:hypothetical protein